MGVSNLDCKARIVKLLESTYKKGRAAQLVGSGKLLRAALGGRSY